MLIVHVHRVLINYTHIYSYYTHVCMYTVATAGDSLEERLAALRK